MLGDDPGDETRVKAPTELLAAALRLYRAARNHQEERDAYLLARAHGLPASYGENDTPQRGDGA